MLKNHLIIPKNVFKWRDSLFLCRLSQQIHLEKLRLTKSNKSELTIWMYLSIIVDVAYIIGSMGVSNKKHFLFWGFQ